MKRFRYCKTCTKVVGYGECDHGVFYDQTNANFSPTVFYKNEQGELWYPPHADARPPKQFGKARREELTSRRQYETFTRELNERDRKVFSEHEAKRVERRNRIKDAGIQRLMSMRKTSDGEGRATIDAAIDYIRSKDSYSPSYHAGNHIHAFEN